MLGVDHFSPRLKPGALVGRHTNLVSDLICDDSFEWNVQLIRNIFNTLRLMLFFKSNCQPILELIPPFG